MKAIKRLAAIAEVNKTDKSHVNYDLYRLLFKEELMILAYEKIKSKAGNVGLDGESMDRIRERIDKLRSESYKFKPAKRIHIPKPGGKDKRPIDIGDPYDKMVLEVVRMILEAIFDGTFLGSSHGFRAGKGCHTALKEVKVLFRGTKWFIEGDIRKYFNTIDQDVLVKLLERRISDARFINLIRKVLGAGYYEFNTQNTDIAGVPQGNIISPILSNIYLHELDVYMGTVKEKYDAGKKRRLTRHYADAMLLRGKATRHGRFGDLKELSQLQRSAPAADPMDPVYRRLNYVRYADDFLIGVAGPRAEAEVIKKDVDAFLTAVLKIRLNDEKTKITNASKDKALFLGVNITCPRYQEEKVVNVIRYGKHFKSRKTSANIRLLLPRERVIKKLQEYSFVDRQGESQPKFA